MVGADKVCLNGILTDECANTELSEVQGLVDVIHTTLRTRLFRQVKFPQDQVTCTSMHSIIPCAKRFEREVCIRSEILLCSLS